MNTALHGHGNVIGDGNTVTVIVNGREETRLFVNVPPKPALLVGRDECLRDLKTRLMNGAAGEPATTAGAAAAISAVRGLPGVRKTTLAAALAHDPDVLAHFGGGILWAISDPTRKRPTLPTWCCACGPTRSAWT